MPGCAGAVMTVVFAFAVVNHLDEYVANSGIQLDSGDCTANVEITDPVVDLDLDAPDGGADRTGFAFLVGQVEGGHGRCLRQAVAFQNLD